MIDGSSIMRRRVKCPVICQATRDYCSLLLAKARSALTILYSYTITNRYIVAMQALANPFGLSIALPCANSQLFLMTNQS
jgi:hypothetical protein